MHPPLSLSQRHHCHIYFLQGEEYLALRILSKKHDFSFSSTPARTFSWVKDSNGQDYGAVYDIHYRFADLGSMPATITFERAKSINFLPFIWTARGFLGTRLPREMPKYTTLFQPFELSVWTTFMIFILAEIVLGFV